MLSMTVVKEGDSESMQSQTPHRHDASQFYYMILNSRCTCQCCTLSMLQHDNAVVLFAYLSLGVTQCDSGIEIDLLTEMQKLIGVNLILSSYEYWDNLRCALLLQSQRVIVTHDINEWCQGR